MHMKRPAKNIIYIFSVVAQLAAVAMLDYYSGYEIRLVALYCMPVAFATWYLGGIGGSLTGVAACLTTLVVESAAGQVYSRDWIAYANAASRLLIFLFVALSFARFRRTIEFARNRVKAFQGKLNVCACCNRIDGGDGFWMDFPTYLRKNSEAVPEFDACPTCIRENPRQSAAK